MKDKQKPGRKPEPNPKVRITVWPRKSTIDSVGGEEAAKEIALNAIEKKSKK